MAAAVAGGYQALREQQHILLYSEPSSPLQQSKTAVDKLVLMAEYELPVVHSPGPLMGGTAPITIAGGLVMSLAEILSSLVIHQMTNPGAPFVFGAGLHHMDMKSTQICYGGPEFQLTKAAVAELGRWYGMPTWGYAGCSDAKVMDEQAAAEAMLSVLMAKLSGANLVHDVGYMESGLTTSFEMIVLTDELVAMVDALIKGIEISDEALLLDELHEVGPGGHFLNTDATMAHFRDFWYPDLMSRGIRETWLERGGTTLGERLREKVRTIIAEHRPAPLAARKKERVQEILREAAR
jgi:trimethylamine--corrinoid protein Co-methyltransferase